MAWPPAFDCLIGAGALPKLSRGSLSSSLDWSLGGSGSTLLEPAMTFDTADGVELMVGTDLAWPHLFAWEGQGAGWTNVSPSAGAAPSERVGEALAYDPVDGYALLYGGISPSCLQGRCGETWAFAGGTWTNLTATAGTPPPILVGATAAYDAADRTVLLFGGSDNGIGYSNETWAFSAGRWTNLTGSTTTAPSPRVSFGMTYDASLGQVLLFGGTGSSGRFLNDTWEYNRSAGWRNVSASLSPTPPPYFGVGLAFDPATGNATLFGSLVQLGARGPTFPSATWEFNGTWTNVTAPGGPTERFLEAFGGDPILNATILYGGFDVAGAGAYGDTWVHGTTWNHTAEPASPSPRVSPAMVEIPTVPEALLVGGGQFHDTWTYRAGAWTEVRGSPRPPLLFTASLVWDAADQEAILFGGSRSLYTAVPTNETWAFANGNWTNLTATSGPPPPRVDAGLGYDAADREVVLFGGYNGTRLYTDTWTFAQGHWTDRTGSLAAHPAGRLFPLMTYDATAGYLLLVGGSALGSCTGLDAACTDEWSFAGQAWTQIHPAAAPVDLIEASLAYDGALGESILFGGITSFCTTVGNSTSCANLPVNYTWGFSGGTWTNLTSSLAHAPSPRSLAALAPDPSGLGLLLFGGDSFDTGWWLLVGAGAPTFRVATPVATPDPATQGSTLTISTSATGGTAPYTFTWSGLPAGCPPSSLGTVTCTPTVNGTFPISVTAHDASSATATSAVLSLVVDPPPATLGSVTIAPDPVGLPPGGSLTLRASATSTDGRSLTAGATFAWSIDPGALATLNRTLGNPVGLTAGPSEGAGEVFVNATWGGGTVSAEVAITVAAASPLSIVAFRAAPPAAPLGVAVTISVDVQGGAPPYAYAYTGLPSGCSNSDAPSLTCTPDRTGAWTVGVEVTDAGTGRANASVTITVGPGGGGGTSTFFGVSPTTWLAIAVAAAAAAGAGSWVALRRRRTPPTETPDNAET